MADLRLASIACAVVGAFLFACAAVAQQRAASSVPEGDSLVSGLVRNPRWWAGIIGDGGGYLMQVIALALGSVLVVQPILVSALVFALPLSARFSGHRIDARTWTIALALTTALAVFLVVGDPTAGDTSAPLRAWLLPLSALLAVVALATAAGLARIDAGWRALLLGTASGLLYGLAAALTKYVTDLFDHGLLAVIGAWQTWVLVAAGIAGVYLQQRAFQVGPLSASLPAVSIAEPIGAAFIGMAVLDERLRANSAGLAITLVAGIVMIVTTILLSRSEAHTATPVAPGTLA
ncbi:hypothetical protein FOS14_02365 [Skermania sp. ID1734]|uniref:DMT family transporter n=1 Tax=Skermania sp. ID1734 TaxID=2597516 RepID=UPI00117EFA03|nr:DMT family transporter [Skermania sp. ID1734]TSE01418.1 hypothetical protein FOS14_02365 [Skermania sp. ID1734]